MDFKMQTLTSLTTCVLQDPAEAITPCYLQVLFWPDPVALTTKEDHRSECNQERNVFVSESLGFRNRIGPVPDELVMALKDPITQWNCSQDTHLKS